MLRHLRSIDVFINQLLNNWLPPVLRDQNWFYGNLIRLACGKNAGFFIDFRQRVYDMSDEEFAKVYADLAITMPGRPTDLNQPCIDAILRDVQGPDILEVGCGRGFLAEKLARQHHVTACDVALDPQLKKDSAVKYIECPAEKLPFEDKSFDTVVCTHTLEHVRDFNRCVEQLRRVVAKRLIIVVPCERPYRHSFNLHVHFFPYASDIYGRLGKHARSQLQKLGGDWYYIEDKA
jgi:ubiquinone/menaquinone biosynthesis C-methylase UbiE